MDHGSGVMFESCTRSVVQQANDGSFAHDVIPVAAVRRSDAVAGHCR